MTVMSIPVDYTIRFLLPVFLGMVIFLVGFCLLLVDNPKKKTGVCLLILGALLAIAGGILVYIHYDYPHQVISTNTAIQELTPYRNQLSETKFYLKEMVQKDLFHGEIKGSVGGLLIAFGGSIYGSIDQEQKLTVVYYDNDTVIDEKVGLHRITSFLLSEIDIYTIGADEKPYFKFVPEIVVGAAQYHVELVIKENPQLYLPEGWEIVGISEKY